MCPVTGGLALAAAVGASGAAATAVAAVGAAAISAGISVAVGGAVNVATGRGFFEGAGKSAMFGAIGGGIAGAAGSVASFTGPLGSVGEFGRNLAGTIASTGSAFNVAATAGLGSLMNSMKPPDFTGYTQSSQYNAFQQLNSTPYAITGSGGKQAASSLAGAISRANKRKLTQDDVSDLSIDTSSFSSTGLQFA